MQDNLLLMGAMNGDGILEPIEHECISLSSHPGYLHGTTGKDLLHIWNDTLLASLNFMRLLRIA